MTNSARLLLIALVGFSLAATIGLFVIPNEATAPSDFVPIVFEPTATTTPSDDVETETAPDEEADPVGEPKAEIKQPEPKIEETIENITKTLTVPMAATSTPLTLNDRVREALVNIICTTGPGSLTSISASGVIVDPKGVIMTNAHVGQYFLLENYPSPKSVECIARTGSPAYPRYKAELLFLPPTWISSNAEKIDDEVPTGNGEHDYALVRITEAIGTNPLPSSFPYLPLKSVGVAVGSEVLIAGYPAGFLGGITIAKELYAVSSPARIGQLYTYEGVTVDLFSIGGTIVAQQGSSGGAVADENGNLIGLIVTSTQAAETSARDLRAIAMSYLSRDFERERGLPLSEYLARDLKTEAELFRVGTAPTLTQALVNVLNK